MSCTSWIASDIGDNTSGIAFWNVWEALRPGSQPALAGPTGTDPSPQNVQNVLSGLTQVMALYLGRTLGLPCGYNTMVFIFALASTLAGYWLLRFVAGANALLSVLGALMLGLGPFSSFMISTHVQWVGHFPLILTLGFTLRVALRPSVRGGIAAGLALLLAGVSEPHMLLAALTIVISVLLGVSLAASRKGTHTPVGTWAERLPSLVAMSATIGAGGLLLGLLLLREASSEGGLGLPNRQASDIWGVSPLEYLAVGASSRIHVLRTGERVWQSIPDSEIAAAYFVGFSLFAGAGLAFFWFFRDASLRLARKPRVLVSTSALLALSGLLIASPVNLQIGSFQIPSLPEMLQGLLPSIRFFWRYLYLVFLALVLLGALGWSWTLNRFEKIRRSSLVIGLVILFAFDMFAYRVFTVRGFNLEYTPDVYEWLRSAPLEDGQYVAELVGSRPSYTTWQVIHGKPLSNDGDPSTSRFEEIEALNGFVHPQTPCLANSLRARYLLRHTAEAPIVAFPGQRLVASFRYSDESSAWPDRVAREYKRESFWYNVDVYENDGVRGTSIYLAYGPGFEGGTYDGIRGVAFMPGNEAFIEVKRVSKIGADAAPRDDIASFDMRAGITPREVVVSRQGGEVLWSGPLGQDWQKVSFPSSGDELLRVTAAGDSEESEVWVGRFGAGQCQ